MPNRCYLTVTDIDTLYPSFMEETFDPTQSTVCTDVESIPLVWMALFREKNIRRQTFDIEGEQIIVEAPIIERAKALTNLDGALKYFNRVFESEGKLDEFFEQMKLALQAVPNQFVTIEMQEVVMLFDDEQWFFDEFRKALKGIGTTPTTAHRERLIGITQLRDDMPFPSARMYLDKLPFGPDDQWNFTRLIGAGQFGSDGWGRPVPWETPDADYTFTCVTTEDLEGDDMEEDEEMEDEK